MKKPPAIVREGQTKYEVKRIVDSRRRSQQLWYLVQWKGYGPEDCSWEPARDVHAPRMPCPDALHLKFVQTMLLSNLFHADDGNHVGEVKPPPHKERTRRTAE
ncbi:chromobox protein homolog 1-like [Ambystoma mexicanum]|uniref:chromobox protein homolog 1-like n=1 Tax=Ambystoma mexicanum TaxID=8296 RepID=UPI0037E7B051